MLYFKVYCYRDFQRSLGNQHVEIELEVGTTPDQILDDVRINVLRVGLGLQEEE